MLMMVVLLLLLLLLLVMTLLGVAIHINRLVLWIAISYFQL